MRVWKPSLSALIMPLAAALLSFGQNPPAGTLPDQAAIVWSGMQQPVPEPAQDTSAREIPPAQQGQNSARNPEEREPPGAQKPGENPGEANTGAPGSSENLHSIHGTVVREGNSYFLRTDENSEFQLDDAAKVRNFENQAVRITGTVDSSTRTIHVRTIEPTT